MMHKILKTVCNIKDLLSDCFYTFSQPLCAEFPEISKDYAAAGFWLHMAAIV